jgi:hypothetical protein
MKFHENPMKIEEKDKFARKINVKVFGFRLLSFYAATGMYFTRSPLYELVGVKI